MTIKEYRTLLRAFLDENNISYQTTDNTSYLFRIAQKGISETNKTFLYSEYKRLSDIEFDEPETKIETNETDKTNNTNTNKSESFLEVGCPGSKETEPQIKEPVKGTQETAQTGEPVKIVKKDNSVWYLLGGLILIIGYMIIKNLNKNTDGSN